MSRETHAPSKCSVGGSAARGRQTMVKHTRSKMSLSRSVEDVTRNPPVRVARNPGDPTDKEVEEHNVTHLPHRSWCPVCVKARGKEVAHKKVREQGEVPTVSIRSTCCRWASNKAELHVVTSSTEAGTSD